MQKPLELQALNLNLSDAERDQIEKEAAKLERHFNRIVGCRVNIEGPSNHHRQGTPFRVSVVLEVPGKDLAVTRKEHETLSGAIHDAFAAAQQRLDDYAAQLRTH